MSSPDLKKYRFDTNKNTRKKEILSNSQNAVFFCWKSSKIQIGGGAALSYTPSPHHACGNEQGHLDIGSLSLEASNIIMCKVSFFSYILFSIILNSIFFSLGLFSLLGFLVWFAYVHSFLFSPHVDFLNKC